MSVGIKAVRLSDREVQIVRAVSEGKTNRQIGLELYLSPATVKTHLQRIAAKVGTGDRTAIVAYCFREGILT